jgi:DNA ligase (NAD+)
MTREEEIVAKLKEWSYNYYETGEVSVDDETFNSYEDELRLLNPNHPILTSPGYGYEFSGIEEKDKFEHPIQVGSITKVKNIDDVIAWTGNDPNASVSTKIDGNSLVLYYKNGKFWKAVTRGRLNIGIDRTAKFIGVVPNELPVFLNGKVPDYVAVRGEAAIRKDEYTTLNGFDIEKSSRNAVAGAISRQDDWEKVMKFVDFIAYTYRDVETGRDLYDDADWASLFTVETQKSFTYPQIKDLSGFKYAIKDSYPYESDGAVFKKSNGSLIAFKFEDEKRLTKAIGYDITVGIDQRLTPVLLLEPVNLNGAMIKRASLGSFGIAIKDGFWPLYEDHIVEIIRSNEIMPHANRVVSRGNRLIDDNKLVPRCPVCGCEGEADGEHYFCVNPDCPNIESSKLLRFSKFFYPEGLSSGIMGKVFRHFKVQEVLDLYELDIDEIEYANIPGVGSSHKEKILNFFTNIHGSVDAKVIYQTYLRSCGKTFSRVIAESGFVWGDLVSADMEKIEKLKDIRGFHRHIVEQMKRSLDLFKKLDSKIKIVDEKITATVGSYCITGTRFSDAQVKRLADMGWKEDSSVKKTTTVLIVVDLDQQSNKTKKAQQYGIDVATIEDFIDQYLS